MQAANSVSGRLDSFISGPVPESHSFPPPVEIHPSKKNRYRKSGHKDLAIERKRPKSFMPAVTEPAQSGSSPVYVYGALRLETVGLRRNAGAISQKRFNAEYGSEVDRIAMECAERHGLDYREFASWIVLNVPAIAPIFEAAESDRRLEEEAEKEVVRAKARSEARRVQKEEAKAAELARIQAGKEERAERERARREAARRQKEESAPAPQVAVVEEVPESDEVRRETIRRYASVELFGVSARRRRAESYMAEMRAK